MNLNHPMPVMKPKPATFILACALLVLVLAYVKGCAPAPAVGQTILGSIFVSGGVESRHTTKSVKSGRGGLRELDAAWRHVPQQATTDTIGRADMLLNLPDGCRSHSPISAGPAHEFTFSNPRLGTRASHVAVLSQGELGVLYATEHQNGLTQPRLADGNLESEPCAWRNTTHSQSHFLCGRPHHYSGPQRMLLAGAQRHGVCRNPLN
jgi:hypothetical protein